MSIRRLVLVIVPLWVLSLFLNVLHTRPETRSSVAGRLFHWCSPGMPATHGPTPGSRCWPPSWALRWRSLSATQWHPGRLPLVVPWLNMATTGRGRTVPRTGKDSSACWVSRPGQCRSRRSPAAQRWPRSAGSSQALAGGLCMWVGVSAFRDAARETDRAAEDLVATQTRTASEAARITPFRSIARALHDTAINTLGVLRLPATIPRAAGTLSRGSAAGSGAAAHGDMVAVTTGVDPARKSRKVSTRRSHLFERSAAVPPAIREALRLGGDGGDAELCEAFGQRTAADRGTWDAGGRVIEVAIAAAVSAARLG